MHKYTEIKSIILSLFHLSFFVLFSSCSSTHTPFAVVDTNKALEYTMDGKHLFTYNYAVTYPPQGVDTAYKRSGFIHPLRTLEGEVLTNCSPSDHYHHFGLWYAWTKTTFEENEIDFWNLYKKQGTVRFRQFVEVQPDGFSAVLDHVVYPDSTKEKIAMTEQLKIRVGKPKQRGYYIDYHTTLRCATSAPVVLESYRYGGICIRVCESWNGQTAEMLTSEGLDRNNADGSLARWCYFQKKPGKDDACILIVPYPSNLNYPEPIRVWDDKANNSRGDLMWNFSPTKRQSFTLHPDKELRLSYRIYVLDESINASTAEALAKEVI